MDRGKQAFNSPLAAAVWLGIVGTITVAILTIFVAFNYRMAMWIWSLIV